MATEKLERHPEHDRRTLTKEGEQVEREIEVNTTSELRDEHKHGVSPTEGINKREPTIVCSEIDDGSGDVTEKCPGVSQQAHHSKCVIVNPK